MRPNILYIHSHDTGRCIQPYGHPVPTPNLHRLAEQGVMFRNAFSVAPSCSPSRAGMLTGQYPHQCGMFGLAHVGWSLDDYRRHLLHTLREQADYYSKLVGFQHVIDWPEARKIGYDEVWGGNNDALAHQVVGPATEFLRNAPDRPWFFSVGIIQTHRLAPHQFFHRDEPKGDARHIRPPGPLPDHPTVRADFADFAESARELDEAVGTVLDELERQGLAGDTLVIATTDHGIPFPRCKCTLYDGGTGVYLIMRGPGGFAGGRVIEPLASHIDVFPTLCDLLEIDTPHWLEGRSLLPLVRGEADSIREEVFTEQTYHVRLCPLRAVRTERYKLIRSFGPRPVLYGGDGPTQRLYREWGHEEAVSEGDELYDLHLDPQENRNLIEDPAHTEVRESLNGRLEQWMRRTGDPLVEGEIPEPAPQ
ncbi:MAG: sulfatase [Candidatus Brocadiia bacterium]